MYSGITPVATTTKSGDIGKRIFTVARVSIVDSVIFASTVAFLYSSIRIFLSVFALPIPVSTDRKLPLIMTKILARVYKNMIIIMPDKIPYKSVLLMHY
jgi:hypothetical protein